MGLALIPLLGAFTLAQSPADVKNNAELLEEMRRMRQLIERLEAEQGIALCQLRIANCFAEEF
ncbi:MAG TPA: hypothetical protein VI479_04690 [Blastocatellia bacterium]